MPSESKYKLPDEWMRQVQRNVGDNQAIGKAKEVSSATNGEEMLELLALMKWRKLARQLHLIAAERGVETPPAVSHDVAWRFRSGEGRERFASYLNTQGVSGEINSIGGVRLCPETPGLFMAVWSREKDELPITVPLTAEDWHVDRHISRESSWVNTAIELYVKRILFVEQSVKEWWEKNVPLGFSDSTPEVQVPMGELLSQLGVMILSGWRVRDDLPLHRRENDLKKWLSNTKGVEFAGGTRIEWLGGRQNENWMMAPPKKILQQTLQGVKVMLREPLWQVAAAGSQVVTSVCSEGKNASLSEPSYNEMLRQIWIPSWRVVVVGMMGNLLEMALKPILPTKAEPERIQKLALYLMWKLAGERIRGEQLARK